jgi:hypothetical protein
LSGGILAGVSCRELELAGEKVFFNETGGRRDLVVCWNEGEDFLSLGLGHFIWYQKDKEGRFTESFPELLAFMRKCGHDIPPWLEDMQRSGYPWKSRRELLDNLYEDDLVRLRHFLYDNLSAQTMFLFQRLNQALPRMTTAAPPDSRQNIERQFHRLADTPGGIYALVDYVNFKGEGILDTESYRGMRWGLLQVLESMQGSQRDISALNEFAANAKRILRRRVRNAPEGVDETRWLPAWERRIDSYVEAFDLFAEMKRIEG